VGAAPEGSYGYLLEPWGQLFLPLLSAGAAAVSLPHCGAGVGAPLPRLGRCVVLRLP
jgi:hypothetical protein